MPHDCSLPIHVQRHGLRSHVPNCVFVYCIHDVTWTQPCWVSVAGSKLTWTKAYATLTRHRPPHNYLKVEHGVSCNSFKAYTKMIPNYLQGIKYLTFSYFFDVVLLLTIIPTFSGIKGYNVNQLCVRGKPLLTMHHPVHAEKNGPRTPDYT